MAKVLIITNSLKLQLTLRFGLLQKSDKITSCTSLEAAKKLLKENEYSSIILHIHNHQESAFTFVEGLRQLGHFNPVIYLGEHCYAEMIKSECTPLEDFLILPFQSTEVLKKLGQAKSMVAPVPKIEFDLKDCRLTVKDTTIRISKIEMKILMLLSHKAGNVVPLRKIYSVIEKESLRINTRVFHHVGSLREKMRLAGINTLSISFAVDGYRLDILA